jgi:beta-1,4-mannosyl-glycoprotein beta-1,4-N-acetylglucosaminyltransferase
MNKLIDCFTFYNELDMLELRLTELYDVADKFILVESDLTHKGENKRLFFEENKWRYEKWIDKIIHVKIQFPKHLDVWGREKYQRNSFMPSLYSLGLSNNDIVVISDLDEIPDYNTLNYIKTSYQMKGLFKLEMDHYWASIYNKLISPDKWYHAKIVDWETLKGRTPDECRLDFNCQWWEKGGWHLSYFGGPEIIINKINSTAHQELNQEKFKVREEVIRKVKDGLDLFDEWRTFQKIDPLENTYLPKNWRILLSNEEKYGNIIKERKNLVIGTALNIGIEETKIFIKSLRKYSNSDICLLVNSSIDHEFNYFLDENNVRTIRNSISSLYQPNINVTRFFQYYDFLSENQEEYQNILITDVTDVFFQNDPFLDLKGEFIYFAEEDEDHTIGSNSFNSRWIQISKGSEYLEKLSDKKIICAGTTIGSYKNILEYLAQMTLILTEVKDQNPSALSESVDQGIHNFICYEKIELFKNPAVKKNGDLIATVGLTLINNPGRISISSDKFLVNDLLPSVVHQYNRSEKISEFINEEYKDKKTLSRILDFNRINGFDSEGGTDKGTLHSYIETYERILSRYIGKKSSILEIGVQYGGSSLLWHEYLEDSNLVMSDIKDQIGKNILDRLNPERYKFHIFDAYTKESLEKIKEENPGGFDILIDDGPHTLDSQKFFIENYISLAKENSVMIIEDIQDINHTTILKECLPEEYRESIEIIDLRNQKNRYDDIMFIVHIGDKKSKSSNLDFTFGWISHNEEAFEKYLGPSLEKINGKYQSIFTDDLKNPAYNYNKIISECKTKWLILCHEDIAFSNDLLDQIKETIKLNPDSKFFGIAGSNGNEIISSNSKDSKDILTTDSCFIVIDTENLDLNFDENTFDDFHLYVEDFCVQLGEKGKTILCDYTEPYNYPDEEENKKKWILHGGSTYFKSGSQWGRYKEYKEKLNKKWGREISTT